MTRSRFVCLAAAGGMLVCTVAIAGPPQDVADLVGVKGRDGETELQARGYELHHGVEAKDGKLTFWKNPAARTCIKVLTQDGRYATVDQAPADACQDAQ